LYKSDGYCKETNTIYEFYGCYFHECKKCYDQHEIDKKTNKKYSELNDATRVREMIIKEKGYKLVTIWECEYDNKLSKKSIITKNITKLIGISNYNCGSGY
jgi:G:T-mismatch repair DNA endonuclease (very short patch repair protein)